MIKNLNTLLLLFKKIDCFCLFLAKKGSRQVCVELGFLIGSRTDLFLVTIFCMDCSEWPIQILSLFLCQIGPFCVSFWITVKCRCKSADDGSIHNFPKMSKLQMLVAIFVLLNVKNKSEWVQINLVFSPVVHETAFLRKSMILIKIRLLLHKH